MRRNSFIAKHSAPSPLPLQCKATVEERISQWQCSQNELSAIKLKQMKVTSRW